MENTYPGHMADGDARMMGLLVEIGRKLDALAESHTETRNKLEQHMLEEDEEIAKVRSAFPGGDMMGHRAYHEEVIAQIKDRREFWKKLSFELAKWGLIGFLGWLVIQVWHGALKGPQ